MSNEMIERVIKVITGLEGCNTNCMHCRVIAKAAIAAMREPTEEMVKASNSGINGIARYQDMIDAALKED